MFEIVLIYLFTLGNCLYVTDVLSFMIPPKNILNATIRYTDTLLLVYNSAYLNNLELIYALFVDAEMFWL